LAYQKSQETDQPLLQESAEKFLAELGRANVGHCATCTFAFDCYFRLTRDDDHFGPVSLESALKAYYA